jgi:hypothetical protein
MNIRLRIALVAAASIATLASANAALAANTGSVTVWHTPQTLANSESTSIHVTVPQSTDPIARFNIYSAAGYTLNTSQAAGATIGTVDATALARDNGLTLPLSGPVVTSDPATTANRTGSVQCAGAPQSQAVWIMNLGVAGNTLAIPLYVNPAVGPERTLGGYKLSICLPPPDVPAGTPGRAFQGAQLLDALLTLKNVFTTPTSGALARWETLFAPYNPGIGTVDSAGTFEARAFVPLPISLRITARYRSRKARTYVVVGRATEGGVAVPDLRLSVLRGQSPTRLLRVGSANTRGSGAYSASGMLKGKAAAYFQVSGSVAARDYTAAGCQSPSGAFAPAGCVKATLSPWSTKSVVVKLGA